MSNAPVLPCQPRLTATRQDDPTPQEFAAWADEAQACINSGEVFISDHRKANATVTALRSHAILKARVEELEGNIAAGDREAGSLYRTLRLQAERIEELETRERQIVDWAVLYASEGQAWVFSSVTEQLVSLAARRAPTQADADHFKNHGTLAALTQEAGK